MAFAFVVYGIEVRCKRRCFLVVVGGKQLERIHGDTHPRCGIDARRDRETDIVFGEDTLIDFRLRKEGAQPGTSRFAQHDESIICKCPVLARKRHHISDRRHAHHIEKPLLPSGRYVPCARTHERLHEFESDTGAAEHLFRIRAIRTLRVDDRIGSRKRFVRQVMIGNDHVYAEILGVLHFFYMTDTMIDRNDDPRTTLGKMFDRRDIETEPFAVAMRDVMRIMFISDLFEKITKRDRTRNPIHVIVTVNDDMFATFNCGRDPRHRTIHILQKKRIVRIALVIRGKKTRGIFLRLYTTRIEEGCDKLGMHRQIGTHFF